LQINTLCWAAPSTHGVYVALLVGSTLVMSGSGGLRRGAHLSVGDTIVLVAALLATVRA
jgi:hypothetical protein